VQPLRDRAANPTTAAGNDYTAAVVFICLRHCFSNSPYADASV